MEVLHVERHRIVAVHLAPACGTASKGEKTGKLGKEGIQNSKASSFGGETHGC